ncbi:UPF0149 family protein [Rehaibacterium terrae]|jgi:uncharacterized protein|uniref:YecA family protein n=1 Tax=Rehaibacterium terrae TaxID=1341696 RepID=A0A7W7XZV4_9GAMM|nr:UPF0149 family protein [Rehaibacterium terrae]MBB5015507.1 uncharacterized protein [Rehaibacterium terrae]
MRAMRTSPAPATLDDAEVARLDDLLERRAVPFRGFSLEALDGFLSALAVGPEPVPAEEWQPLVWGPKPPRWDSAELAAEVERLLGGLWNTVLRRVRHDGDDLPEALAPLVALPDDPLADHPDDLDIGHDWALGFFAGIELRGEAWDRWLDAEPWIDEAVELLERLATGEVLAADPQDPPTPLSYRERLEIVFAIPDLLADLHQHRIDQATPRAPVRRAPQPGRNDPCPCGSGRKFKVCCAAA